MGVSTPLPSDAAIKRAEALTRERFVLDGESAEQALAPGTIRRRALDAALLDVEANRLAPSVAWRQEYSLLLGLERVLSEQEPHLADGTVLSAHQVDALSGTLTALLAADAVAAPGAGPLAGPDGEAADASVPLTVPTPPPLAGAVNHDADAGDEDLEADDEPADDEDDEDTDEDEATGADEDDEGADEGSELDDDVQLAALGDDPGADRRFWFEHATGAGKTVAALGFVEASRTGGVLILTHRRNLVDQFIGELKTRGYRDRLCAPLLKGQDAANGPVTVETYQWFVRNAGLISSAYTIVICDEAHTALGEKTSAAIRAWYEPIWIGMTATGALIARHVTDLFPTQTSRFDLAQAARRGVIAPLRCIRIPPGPGVRTIAKVPLRRGEIDTEFDQEMLAGVLDHLPFNLAIADLYKTRFNNVPGVVYAAGVRHAYNVAASFRDVGIKAMAVSGETPKRELAQILADYESGKIDVLVNAQLLAEGWNSPRATICMHLAPTASKRIYQQRVGRVTRRHPGKEAGIVIDFVHPATKHDDPVVTLHSLLDRDVYRGGAIVVGPVRRGRGRRVRVERRVLPVTPDPERRAEVFERELWRIAVEHLDYGEQHVWAALAGARVAPNGWRRAKAMLHFDRQGELKDRFLINALQRNRSGQVRLRALAEIAQGRNPDAFDTAIDIMGPWPRDERREGVKIMLLALAEKRIGRRDQASAWIWRMAEYTREVHEEYAVQRWPETKRLLGLLVNSSGSAHARNARRIVHATRKQDRRLSAALLAAAVAHTPEAEEALRGARTRMARKPATLARDLLRNFPKGKRSKTRTRNRKTSAAAAAAVAVGTETIDDEALGAVKVIDGDPDRVRPRRGARSLVTADGNDELATAVALDDDDDDFDDDTPVLEIDLDDDDVSRGDGNVSDDDDDDVVGDDDGSGVTGDSEGREAKAADGSRAAAAPKPRRRRSASAKSPQLALDLGEETPKPRRARRSSAKPAPATAATAASKPAANAVAEPTSVADTIVEPVPQPRRARRPRATAAGNTQSSAVEAKTKPAADTKPATKRATTRRKTAAAAQPEVAKPATAKPAATKPRTTTPAAATPAATTPAAATPAAAKPRATKPRATAANTKPAGTRSATTTGTTSTAKARTAKASAAKTSTAESGVTKSGAAKPRAVQSRTGSTRATRARNTVGSSTETTGSDVQAETAKISVTEPVSSVKPRRRRAPQTTA